MLSNESGPKSNTDNEKAAAWIQRVIQSGTKKLIIFLVILTNTDLNELVSTSADTSYSQDVIQNDNENELSEDNPDESFEDNADDDSDKDLYDDSEDDNESNNIN